MAQPGNRSEPENGGVLGVLVEKAKTTPDVYPMTINALRSGANQKNNRYPLMELDNDDVEQSLDRLRELGAVSEVQGDSRVSRYRHLLYDWLGVEKLELAVMGELLSVRGPDRRRFARRAARMDPIPDLTTLRNLVSALKARGLIVGLTPEGRGHVLTRRALSTGGNGETACRISWRGAGRSPIERACRGVKSDRQPGRQPDCRPRASRSPAADGRVAGDGGK